MDSSEDGLASNTGDNQARATSRWKRIFGNKPTDGGDVNEEPTYRSKSTLGILSDKETDEVPGMLNLKQAPLSYPDTDIEVN